MNRLLRSARNRDQGADLLDELTAARAALKRAQADGDATAAQAADQAIEALLRDEPPPVYTSFRCLSVQQQPQKPPNMNALIREQRMYGGW